MEQYRYNSIHAIGTIGPGPSLGLRSNQTSDGKKLFCSKRSTTIGDFGTRFDETGGWSRHSISAAVLVRQCGCGREPAKNRPERDLSDFSPWYGREKISNRPRKVFVAVTPMQRYSEQVELQ